MLNAVRIESIGCVFLGRDLSARVDLPQALPAEAQAKLLKIFKLCQGRQGTMKEQVSGLFEAYRAAPTRGRRILPRYLKAASGAVAISLMWVMPAGTPSKPGL